MDEVNLAVEMARSAWPSWHATPIAKRIEFLEKFAKRVDNGKEEMAMAISLEVGKPLWEARTEVAAMVGKIAISIAAYHERCPTKESTAPLGKSVTRHKGHGVVAVFGPYNFPAHLPNGHIVPALLAGNVVVFKPSPYTPLVANVMVRFWKEVDLPAGVLQVLQGGKEVGIALAHHKGIDGLFFTGSAATGQSLMRSLAEQPHKILALELGGNNPLVVMPGVDITAAAYATTQSAFLTAGQRCTCARRLIVPQGHEGDQFIERLISMTKGLVIGLPEPYPTPFMGPVISSEVAMQLLKSFLWLEECGGRVLLPMTRLQADTGLLSPGIIDMTDASIHPDEEFFGPLLQVFRVRDLAHAIEVSNNTRFGLSSGIFTPHEEEYQQYYEGVRAGLVNWNTQLTGASSGAPFGGVGHSGNYRPSAYYAADYCAYPVASMENKVLAMPEKLLPGVCA